MKNKTLKQFYQEFNKFKETKENICLDCLEKQFGKHIGDRKKYEGWLMGNTMVLVKCSRCGLKENGILPYGDFERAIRASQVILLSLLNEIKIMCIQYVYFVCTLYILISYILYTGVSVSEP